MGKKHFSGERPGGPGGIGRSKFSGSREGDDRGDRSDRGGADRRPVGSGERRSFGGSNSAGPERRPATNGAFGRSERPATNGAFGRPDRSANGGAFGRPERSGGNGGAFGRSERQANGGAFGRPERGGSAGFGASRGFGSAGRDEKKPRPEQRSGTGYGRFAPDAPASREPQGPDSRPVRDYQPRENWTGQPYRHEGKPAVPRGAAGERNRKFNKQNPNETPDSSEQRGSVGFGRSQPSERPERPVEARGPGETGPNRPIRAARPFSAQPPEPREERGSRESGRDGGRENSRDGGRENTRSYDRDNGRNDNRGGYEQRDSRDQRADEAAFGRKFTPGAFGPREAKFNPRSSGEKPGYGSAPRNADRPARPESRGDWAGGSHAPGTSRGSFAERREALKAQERGVRRSGTAYGSGTGAAPRNGPDARTAQPNRADKPRFGETPGEAPDYKNLKHYENDPSRGNKRRRQEDQDGPGDETRLNRYIANAGICSRREADELIAAGDIRVNGEVMTEMGYKVQPTDTVQYGKTDLKREKNVYVLLNKPKDFLTTTDDPEGRRTVMDLVAGAGKERIFPVGRLDRNTTGLLLFTNDGEVAQKLSHPSHLNKKIYQVELSTPLTEADLQAISEGVELEDGKATVDDVAVVAGNPHFVGIEIHIGRNRIVRRIFEHLGYEVVALDRVQYAGLTKKELPRGKWRFLSEQEVIRLKYFV